MNRWAAPIGASRTGAAHRRAGRPCQDALLCGELRSADGQPVMVMAVADGHGGRRYLRSDVGSRLACERALVEVQRTLGERPLGGGAGEADWSRWLERELPAAIERGWLEAVEAHWREEPGEGPFLPLLYGSTLGLVVMTARWWGHTGLGDWDLVRVEADGRPLLIEEESETIAPGEATCSLCQPQAASLFARRASLHPIAPDDGDFALVLCTDGIRKSCATDADFLTLAAWLARIGAEPASEGPGTLPAALDRISREGSGDDVTVAIGRRGPAAEGTAAAGAGAQVLTSSSPLSPQAPPASAPESPSGAPLLRHHRPAIGRAVAIGLGLAAAGGLLLALFWPRGGPPELAPSSSPGLQAAREEVGRLCGQPTSIPLALRRRRQLFVALRQGRQDPGLLKAAASGDPLAALIAADLPAPSPLPSPQASPPRARPLLALGACPALLDALDQQWASPLPAATPAP